MNREREVKLLAPAGFRMPDLAGDGVNATGRDPQRLVTVYLDTQDLRLARWGCSVRIRRGDGWTVKLPPADDGILMVRPEHTFEGSDPRKPPARAVELVRAYVRAEAIAPILRLHTVRRAVELADELGRPLAIVTDDEVSVMEGRRVASRFREVEVELHPGSPPEVAESVVARLREAGAGTVDNVSKLRRSLGAPAEEPPEVVVPEVDEDSTVEAVVRRALAASVVRLLRHDAGVRLGDDGEDVHQARVATRRLRSDLRTFRDVLEPGWSRPLRDELRWLGRELGAVRDAEVLYDRIRSREPLLAAKDRPPMAKLAEMLDRRRGDARERLLAEMAHTRYVELLDVLVDAAGSPPVLDDVATNGAAGPLGALLDAPWKHLRGAVDRAEADPTDETLHGARIRAKRVRYAAEAIAPVFGRKAKAFARAAERLQDILGEHQDAVVASAWLREAGSGSRGLAFAAGQLTAIEGEAARAARGEWPDAWKKLSRKKLRFWT